MNLSTTKIRAALASGTLTVVILGGSLGIATYEWHETIRVKNELTALASRYVSLEHETALLANSLKSAPNLSREAQAQLEDLQTQKSSSLAVKSSEQILTSVVAQVTPAVVSVIISKDVPKVEIGYEEDSFFGLRIPTYKKTGTEKQEIGAGSGFIIRSDGYILTNRHVAFDDEAEYTVLLSNGTEKKARIIARDPDHDLALLKIDGTGYSTLPIGNSSKVQLGQTVVAIGNALGEYSNSVSVGIVSGLNRTLEALDENGDPEKLDGVIQTDAAINRGNSGGPLLDLRGQVIGINVAIIRGSNSIAFAIPANATANILKKLN